MTFDATTVQGAADWSKQHGGVPFRPSTLQSLSDAGYINQGEGGYYPPGTIGPDSGSPSGYSTGGGGGYSSGGSSAPAVDPKQVALYDQSIGNTQAAIDRLPQQGASGWSSIDSSYDDALNQLLGGKNRAEGSYNTNKLQTAQDWRGSKNTISDNAGSSLRGLLRLLGIRGAGGGSAYRFSAPDAVISGANAQRGQVGQTFGRNQQALDTNWNNYLTDYENQRSSATSQRDRQRQQLQQSIGQNQASLLQSLAGLQAQKASYTGGDPSAASQGSIDQANGLLNNLSNYSVAPIAYNVQAYNAPSLDKYTVNPNAAPQYSQQASSDSLSPYLATLLGKDKQKLAFGVA